MCHLQIINDSKHLSLTLHGVNGTFIHHPSNVENYLYGHKSEMGQLNQKKYIYTSKLHIFTPVCKFLAQNSKYKWAKVFVELFWHLDNWHLTAYQTAKQWYGQKSKIG